MCFWYTSLAQARVVLKSGLLPALVGSEGIVVSLWGPHQIQSDDDLSLAFMGPLASSREAVLCLSLPKNMLWKHTTPIKSKSASCDQLRIIPSDVLEALTYHEPEGAKSKVAAAVAAAAVAVPAPSSKKAAEDTSDLRVSESWSIPGIHFSGAKSSKAAKRSHGGSGVLSQLPDHRQQQRQQQQILAIPATCVIRAFQLKDKATELSHSHLELLRTSTLSDLTVLNPWQPKTCEV